MSARAATRPRDLESEQTRRAILEAAEGLLAAGGEGGLSIRELCRRAEVTAPTIYHHFGDKQALVDRVVDDCFATFDAVLARRAGEGGDQLGGRLASPARQGTRRGIAALQDANTSFRAERRCRAGGPPGSRPGSVAGTKPPGLARTVMMHATPAPGATQGANGRAAGGGVGGDHLGVRSFDPRPAAAEVGGLQQGVAGNVKVDSFFGHRGSSSAHRLVQRGEVFAGGLRSRMIRTEAGHEDL